jgi:hypothetical protein
VLSLAVPLAALGVASPALATPKGAFAVFAQCPTSTPGVTICTYAQSTSGEFTIGKTTVPINKTITLQGGGIPDPGEENAFFLAPAKNGESLSKTELNVPGGLLNLINCKEISNFLERISCELIFENGLTGVTAVTELVANKSNPAIFNAINILNEEKTGLVLPVRVKLNNPLLGSGCFIGSESHPVQLHLTSGTTSPPAPNKPIKGKAGELSVEEEAILVLKNNSLVDNAFAAPAAEGCGGLFSFLIDPILDSKIGLPAAAGHNTAILNGTLKTTSAEAVIKSE